MGKKFKYALVILLSGALLWGLVLLLEGSTIAVLSPKGLIAMKERRLIVIASLLMLIVVLPTLLLTLFIAWKYRESNKAAKYSPNWDYSLLAEGIWWGVPFVIIAILSVLTWKSCHELDPFRPLISDVKPVRIQVVALQWKWLFIYPEQKIASVNYVQFPEKTPINFEVSADAPMNSFWIPELGGQIYAMPGMSAKIHLIADQVGSFPGSSANISGRGFANMRFMAKASSQEEFDAWVQSVKQSAKPLNLDEYNRLVEPTESSPVQTYVLEKDDLYDWIVMKYMTHE